MDDMLRYAWGEYRAWAATSRLLQTRLTRWSTLVLVLTLAGTLLGTMSPSISSSWPSIGFVSRAAAAVALGLATYFASQILSDAEQQASVKARALAEGLKSESYKYITGAPPYDVLKPAAVLARKVGELQGLMLGVLGEALSAEERAKNAPEAAWSIDDYIHQRVREQIDRFYLPGIARHRASMNQARTVALVLGAAAVILSASGSGGTRGTVVAALLGTVTTAAAAVATWFQRGHHQQVAQNYQAAVAKLEILLASYGTHATDKQLIVDAEAVFQLEHAAWLAEWQTQSHKQVGAGPPTPAATAVPGRAAAPTPP